MGAVLRSEMTEAFVHDAAGIGHDTPSSVPDTNPESLIGDYVDPVSPLGKEDEEILAGESETSQDQFEDAEAEADDGGGPTVSLNMSAWGTRTQTEEDKRALMPPPRAPASRRGAITRSLPKDYHGEDVALGDVVNALGEISCLDGEVVTIPPDFLIPGDDGLPKRVDPNVRRRLLKRIPKDEYDLMPHLWFANWIHLAIGMAVNPTFKEAVIQVSNRSRAQGEGGFVTTSETETEMEVDADQLADEMSTVDLGMDKSQPQEETSQAEAGNTATTFVGELLKPADFQQLESEIRDAAEVSEAVRIQDEEDQVSAKRLEEIRTKQEAIKLESAALKKEKQAMDKSLSQRRREERRQSRLRGKGSDSDSSVISVSPKKPARKKKEESGVPEKTDDEQVLESDSEFTTKDSKKRKQQLKRLSQSLEDSKRAAATKPVDSAAIAPTSVVVKPLKPVVSPKPDTRPPVTKPEVVQHQKPVTQSIPDTGLKATSPKPAPRKPKAREVKKCTGSTEEPMEVTPEASLALPKPTGTPEESPAASPVTSDEDGAGSAPADSDSDAETLDEQASNLVEQEVWDNAKAEFSIRLPRSFEECKRNSKHYACPPEVDMNEESDDEEWLRLKSTEKSANRHYHVLFAALSNKKIGNAYYHYEQRTKLQYVAKHYDAASNAECPFTVCSNAAVDEKRYPSRNRFIRHLVEVHMHHRPEYECVTERGKINASCLGLKTPRRGVLIRHLKICHKTGMVAGREQVLDLHDRLWENWKKEEEVIGTLRPSMAVICEVSPRTSAKLNARMVKTTQHNKFDLPEDVYQKVLKWRQKSGKPNLRSPRGQSPSATVSKKKRTEITITAPLNTVPAVGQRQPSPLSEGSSCRDAAWGAPSAYKDWFSVNFPSVGKPGPESQTLTTLGRGKGKAPVVGGRGNTLVQTSASVGRGRGTPKPQAETAAAATARIPDPAVIPPGDVAVPPVGPPATAETGG